MTSATTTTTMTTLMLALFAALVGVVNAELVPFHGLAGFHPSLAETRTSHPSGRFHSHDYYHKFDDGTHARLRYNVELDDEPLLDLASMPEVTLVTCMGRDRLYIEHTFSKVEARKIFGDSGTRVTGGLRWSCNFDPTYSPLHEPAHYGASHREEEEILRIIEDVQFLQGRKAVILTTSDAHHQEFFKNAAWHISFNRYPDRSVELHDVSHDVDDEGPDAVFGSESAHAHLSPLAMAHHERQRHVDAERARPYDHTIHHVYGDPSDDAEYDGDAKDVRYIRDDMQNDVNDVVENVDDVYARAVAGAELDSSDVAAADDYSGEEAVEEVDDEDMDPDAPSGSRQLLLFRRRRRRRGGFLRRVVRKIKKVAKPLVQKIKKKIVSKIKAVASKVIKAVKNLPKTIKFIAKVVLTGKADVNKNLWKNSMGWNYDASSDFAIKEIPMKLGMKCYNCYFDFTNSVDLVVDIKKWKLKVGRLTHTGIIRANIGIQFPGQDIADNGFSWRKKLGNLFSKTFSFAIGPIPVVCKFDVPFFVGFDFAIQTSGALTSDINWFGQVVHGVEIVNGKFKTINTKEYRKTGSLDEVIDKINGFVATVYLEFLPSMEINKILSVTIKLRPFIRLTLDLIRDRDGPEVLAQSACAKKMKGKELVPGEIVMATAVSIGMEISIRAAIEIKLFKKKVFSKEWPFRIIWKFAKTLVSGCVKFPFKIKAAMPQGPPQEIDPVQPPMVFCDSNPGICPQFLLMPEVECPGGDCTPDLCCLPPATCAAHVCQSGKLMPDKTCVSDMCFEVECCEPVKTGCNVSGPAIFQSVAQMQGNANANAVGAGQLMRFSCDMNGLPETTTVDLLMDVLAINNQDVFTARLGLGAECRRALDDYTAGTEGAKTHSCTDAVSTCSKTVDIFTDFPRMRQEEDKAVCVIVTCMNTAQPCQLGLNVEFQPRAIARRRLLAADATTPATTMTGEVPADAVVEGKFNAEDDRFASSWKIVTGDDGVKYMDITMSSRTQNDGWVAMGLSNIFQAHVMTDIYMGKCDPETGAATMQDSFSTSYEAPQMDLKGSIIGTPTCTIKDGITTLMFRRGLVSANNQHIDMESAAWKNSVLGASSGRTAGALDSLKKLGKSMEDVDIVKNTEYFIQWARGPSPHFTNMHARSSDRGVGYAVVYDTHQTKEGMLQAMGAPDPMPCRVKIKWERCSKKCGGGTQPGTATFVKGDPVTCKEQFPTLSVSRNCNLNACPRSGYLQPAEVYVWKQVQQTSEATCEASKPAAQMDQCSMTTKASWSKWVCYNGILMQHHGCDEGCGTCKGSVAQAMLGQLDSAAFENKYIVGAGQCHFDGSMALRYECVGTATRTDVVVNSAAKLDIQLFSLASVPVTEGDEFSGDVDFSVVTPKLRAKNPTDAQKQAWTTQVEAAQRRCQTHAVNPLLEPVDSFQHRVGMTLPGQAPGVMTTDDGTLLNEADRNITKTVNIVPTSLSFQVVSLDAKFRPAEVILSMPTFSTNGTQCSHEALYYVAYPDAKNTLGGELVLQLPSVKLANADPSTYTLSADDKESTNIYKYECVDDFAAPPLSARIRDELYAADDPAAQDEFEDLDTPIEVDTDWSDWQTPVGMLQEREPVFFVQWSDDFHTVKLSDRPLVVTDGNRVPCWVAFLNKHNSKKVVSQASKTASGPPQTSLRALMSAVPVTDGDVGVGDTDQDNNDQDNNDQDDNKSLPDPDNDPDNNNNNKKKEEEEDTSSRNTRIIFVVVGVIVGGLVAFAFCAWFAWRHRKSSQLMSSQAYMMAGHDSDGGNRLGGGQRNGGFDPAAVMSSNPARNSIKRMSAASRTGMPGPAPSASVYDLKSVHGV